MSALSRSQVWTPSPVARAAVRAMALGRFAGSGVAADGDDGPGGSGSTGPAHAAGRALATWFAALRRPAGRS